MAVASVQSTSCGVIQCSSVIVTTPLRYRRSFQADLGDRFAMNERDQVDRLQSASTTITTSVAITAEQLSALVLSSGQGRKGGKEEGRTEGRKDGRKERRKGYWKEKRGEEGREGEERRYSQNRWGHFDPRTAGGIVK